MRLQLPQMNLIRLVVFLISIFGLVSVPLNASPNLNKCIYFYDQILDSKNLAKVSTILQTDFTDAQSSKLRLEMVELTPDDLSLKSSQVLGKAVFTDRISAEKIKQYLKLVSETKFLLSKLHEKLMINALGAGHGGYETGLFGNYWVTVNREELIKYKSSIVSDAIGDRKFKYSVAQRMVEDLYEKLPINIDSWETLSSLDKESGVTELAIASRNTLFKQMKWMDLMLPIFRDPQGREFLATIFASTMPDIYSIALSRTSLIPKRVAGWSIAVGSIVASSFLPTGHEGFNYFLGSVGSVAGWQANNLAYIKGMGLENVVASTNKLGRQLFVKDKARKSFEIPTDNLIEEVVKKNAALEAQSLLALAQIKKELTVGLTNQYISVPNWARALSDAISVLINRTQELGERLEKIDKEIFPIHEENQSSTKTENLARKQMNEMLVNVARDQLQAALVEMQILKEELLTLAYALDKYTLELDKAKSQHGIAENYHALANIKDSELKTQSLIIANLANRLKTLEFEITEKFAYLNTLHSGIQVKQLSGK